MFFTCDDLILNVPVWGSCIDCHVPHLVFCPSLPVLYREWILPYVSARTHLSMATNICLFTVHQIKGCMGIFLKVRNLLAGFFPSLLDDDTFSRSGLGHLKHLETTSLGRIRLYVRLNIFNV